MSYFVDDYLLHISDNQIDTTDFFRRCMAGFLISTHETALSVCRSNDNFVNSSMCQMILATEIVEKELAFTDTVYRQQYQNSTNCTMLAIQGKHVLTYVDALKCSFDDGDIPPDATSFPFCPDFIFDVDNETFAFVSGNGTTDAQIATNFSVDGAVRDRFDGFGGHFGRVHYTPISTQMTGATVYYNNQVYLNDILCMFLFACLKTHLYIITQLLQ